jgi:hypothetical protein
VSLIFPKLYTADHSPFTVIAAQQPLSPLLADAGTGSDMPITDSDILPDEPLSTAQNFKIINTLQTQVEPELFAKPGVYDGRKNLFTAFELPFESGTREASPPGCK